VVEEDELVTLVALARAGDRDAFAELYRRFHRAVHGVVLARVAFGDAADLVQDVFAIALERLPQLADPSARPSDELVDVPAPIVRSAEVAQALAALRELPDAYRETMILRLVEGMTGPEIAEQTGMSAGSVRVNLHRGMKLLRERLGKETPDGDEVRSRRRAALSPVDPTGDDPPIDSAFSVKRSRARNSTNPAGRSRAGAM
jgi:RNA polymerase sigma-70 factor, ECF subfamily